MAKKFRIWLFIAGFTLILPFAIFAKESSRKVLLQKINSSKYSAKDRMYFADTLILLYRKTNPDSALYFTRKMLSYAEKINDQSTIDYGIVHLGSIKRIKGELDSSIYYYKIALKRYRKRNYEEGIASIYSNLANVYKLQSRYDLAIKNYLEALDVFKNTDNHNAIANLLSGLAGLYLKLENYEKAFEYWKKSEPEYLKGNPKHEVSHAYRGKARIYLQNKKFAKANAELKKAKEIDLNSGVEVFMLEDLLLEFEINLAEKNVTFIKPVDLNNYIKKIRPLLAKTEIPLSKAKFYELAGDGYYYLGQSEIASKYYDSSLTITLKEDVPEQNLVLLRNKFKIDLSDFNPTLFNSFIKLSEYQNKVEQLRKERITQETDARYSLKDKEEKINTLNERNKTAHALIEKEKELSLQTRKQNIFLWAGIGLFLIFIIYILITNHKLNITKKELQKNIAQKEYLFRELNHRVKNNLHIVSSFLSIESFGKSDEIQKILHTCENRIHSLGLVHEMLYKGEISENIEVKSYFEKLIQVIKETLLNDDSEINFSINANPLLPSNKMVLAGLIANELITNSIKYAKQPGKKLIIDVTINTENEKIILDINDNGQGISEENLSPNSMGLKMAKGLARQLDAQLEIGNTAKGAQFRLLF